MSSHQFQAVKFYGGPMDGHVNQLCLPMKPFLVIKTLAHARDASSVKVLFRILLFYEQLQPFVLAVYELQSSDSGIVYQYLRSTVAIDTALDPTLVEAMVQNSDQSLRPMETRLQ